MSQVLQLPTLLLQRGECCDAGPKVGRSATWSRRPVTVASCCLISSSAPDCSPRLANASTWVEARELCELSLHIGQRRLRFIVGLPVLRVLRLGHELVKPSGERLASGPLARQQCLDVILRQLFLASKPDRSHGGHELIDSESNAPQLLVEPGNDFRRNSQRNLMLERHKSLADRRDLGDHGLIRSRGLVALGEPLREISKTLLEVILRHTGGPARNLTQAGAEIGKCRLQFFDGFGARRSGASAGELSDLVQLRARAQRSDRRTRGMRRASRAR